MRTTALISILFILLAGCSAPAANTALPATATALPPQPAATQTPMLATATMEVEATQSPLAARITILEPGNGSKVSDSVTVRGYAEPTFEQHLGILVTGDDGTILEQGYATINAEMGMPGPFEAVLYFSNDREQSGRISVYDTGARDGGLLYLTSVWVTLLPSGAAGIPGTPAGDGAPFFRIDQPAPFGQVSGGILHVEGFSGPAFENTILVTLCGEGGVGEADLICGTQDNLLLTVPVQIQSADIGQPGTFSVDLPYTVSQETFARVAVYVLSPMDGRVVELNSVEVQLLP